MDSKLHITYPRKKKSFTKFKRKLSNIVSKNTIFPLTFMAQESN